MFQGVNHSLIRKFSHRIVSFNGACQNSKLHLAKLFTSMGIHRLVHLLFLVLAWHWLDQNVGPSGFEEKRMNSSSNNTIPIKRWKWKIDKKERREREIKPRFVEYRFCPIFLSTPIILCPRPNVPWFTVSRENLDVFQPRQSGSLRE